MAASVLERGPRITAPSTHAAHSPGSLGAPAAEKTSQDPSRDALAAGADTVIVHGGDGTVNEALQPMVGGPTGPSPA